MCTESKYSYTISRDNDSEVCAALETNNCCKIQIFAYINFRNFLVGNTFEPCCGMSDSSARIPNTSADFAPLITLGWNGVHVSAAQMLKWSKPAATGKRRRYGRQHLHLNSASVGVSLASSNRIFAAQLRHAVPSYTSIKGFLKFSVRWRSAIPVQEPQTVCIRITRRWKIYNDFTSGDNAYALNCIVAGLPQLADRREQLT